MGVRSSLYFLKSPLYAEMLEAFEQCLHEVLPKLASHLENNGGLPSSHWVLSWHLTSYCCRTTCNVLISYAISRTRFSFRSIIIHNVINMLFLSQFRGYLLDVCSKLFVYPLLSSSLSCFCFTCQKAAPQHYLPYLYVNCLVNSPWSNFQSLGPFPLGRPSSIDPMPPCFPCQVESMHSPWGAGKGHPVLTKTL